MNQQVWIQKLRLPIIGTEDPRFNRVERIELTTADLTDLETDPRARTALRDRLPKGSALRNSGEFGVLERTGPDTWLLPVCNKSYAVEEGQ